MTISQQDVDCTQAPVLYWVLTSTVHCMQSQT